MYKVLALTLTLVAYVQSHGRLNEPPSRASAWRFGFDTPKNYQDNELYCGGFPNQQNHGGKCGVCGDPFQGPRQHEAAGKFATGKITRRYDQGSKMTVQVDLTANHKGWMEFRLCPVNDPKVRATHECLDQNLLTISGTGSTRFSVDSSMKIINLEMELPEGLTCSQCVLQWKYHAGNSWGVDQVTNKGCVGCGPQEEFYGCSDIAIDGNSSGKHPATSLPVRPTPPAKHITTPPKSKTMPPPTKPTTRFPWRPSSTRRPAASTRRPISPPKGKMPPAGWCGMECCSVGVWMKMEKMNIWCMNNCIRGYCPASHCKCIEL